MWHITHTVLTLHNMHKQVLTHTVSQLAEKCICSLSISEVDTFIADPTLFICCAEMDRRRNLGGEETNSSSAARFLPYAHQI